MVSTRSIRWVVIWWTGGAQGYDSKSQDTHFRGTRYSENEDIIQDLVVHDFDLDSVVHATS